MWNYWNQLTVNEDTKHGFTSMLPLLLDNKWMTCMASAAVHLSESILHILLQLI